MFSDDSAKYGGQWITLRSDDDRNGQLSKFTEICAILCRVFVPINYAQFVSRFVVIFKNFVISREEDFRRQQSLFGGKVHGT